LERIRARVSAPVMATALFVFRGARPGRRLVGVFRNTADVMRHPVGDFDGWRRRWDELPSLAHEISAMLAVGGPSWLRNGCHSHAVARRDARRVGASDSAGALAELHPHDATVVRPRGRRRAGCWRSGHVAPAAPPSARPSSYRHPARCRRNDGPARSSSCKSPSNREHLQHARPERPSPREICAHHTADERPCATRGARPGCEREMGG
jgi:hypothetical protein